MAADGLGEARTHHPLMLLSMMASLARLLTGGNFIRFDQIILSPPDNSIWTILATGGYRGMAQHAARDSRRRVST